MTLLAGPVRAPELYDAALRDGGRLSVGCAAWTYDLPLELWCGQADPDDDAALARLRDALPAEAAVLDLGCGPGRHAARLAGWGLGVLGVDTSPTAVALTAARGVAALRTDALGPLPGGCHGWDGVLLLDGNIGLGGDPLLLLCRVRDLLTDTGRVLVELDPEGVTDRRAVRLSDGALSSRAFRWARLGADGVAGAAGPAGLAELDRLRVGDRLFALLGPVLP